MDVIIKRSNKRTKTVSARQVNGVLEISAPAHLTDKDLHPIIEQLRNRIAQREKRQTQRKTLSDADLEKMAARLNQQYFQGALTWESIAWSTRQNKRYGSCTPSTKTIRISDRLTKMPRFVQEYVVMHELAHLVEGNHGPRFWKLVKRYPLTERARGYLMALGMEEIKNQSDDKSEA
jgi:predicted metal-dependent hydrolase